MDLQVPDNGEYSTITIENSTGRYTLNVCDVHLDIKQMPSELLINDLIDDAILCHSWDTPKSVVIEARIVTDENKYWASYERKF